MHAEVEEGIGLARFRKVIAFTRRFRFIEQGMVFGMAQGHLHDQFFHALERPSFAVCLPGAKENLARLSTILSAVQGQTALALNRPRIAEYWNR